MARHPLSSFADLWHHHEQLYLEVFSEALLKLIQKGKIFHNEDAISESLCVDLNEVCFEISKSRQIEVNNPVWEGPIQPVKCDELKGGKVRKRPDFTCKRMNRFASSADEHEISLHVECKQLGNPTSSSWILTENYVTKGIIRFDSTTHEYGKRAPAGFMIGYLVNMTPESILMEVNSYQKKCLQDNPELVFTFDGGRLFESQQPLSRKHVLPEKFNLFHLWADLRV